MVENYVDNLLLKNSVEIKVDRWPWVENKMWSSEENWKIHCL